MNKLKQWLILLTSMLLFPAYTAAQDIYRMTGAARFDQGSDFHNLSFPVNPVTAGFMTLDGNKFVYHETGSNCSVSVHKRMNFYVDPVIAHSFGSLEKLNGFLSSRFHANGSALTETYLLDDADAPLCRGLRYATIYKSPDEMLLLDGSWAYLFARQTNVPKNSEQSFDCKEANTRVEQLICNNSELVQLDATVNRGYVAMQLTDSKEISYRDPVRLDQISWIRKVRNACADNRCLLNAYRARIQYIKTKIAATYPSYPEDDPEEESD